MLTKLPTELLCSVLNYLEYDDLDTLLQIESLEDVIRHHLHRHYRFHYQISSLLRLFESLTPTERHKSETRNEFAQQLLQLICHIVERCPKFEHRAKFTALLDTLQYLVVKRILAADIRPGMEHDYASLCLDIRHIYLHSPAIRVLHDPKYRRRSTKYPLAPFLPRDYTWVWRRQCAGAAGFLKPWTQRLFVEEQHYCSQKKEMLQARETRLRFAQFFGSLFEVTSLYLESNLDGTFEECAREALVSGDVESLLVMCAAADRPVDVQGMCMMVTHAGEQLFSYLDTMEEWMTIDPTPQQRARMARHQEEDWQSETITPPPDWLMPNRYKVEPDTRLRLTLMNGLYKKGWRWFH